MRAFAVALVRNEIDVLESWVRYHTQLFDRLVIMDHISVDGSYELARQLQADGLPIDVLRTDEPIYDQSRMVTSLAREAVERGADWVFPLDADEFLDTDSVGLFDVLNGVEQTSPLAVPWRTYVPTSGDRQDEPNVLLRITWCLRDELRPYSKVAVPSGLLMNPLVALSMGSHELRESGKAIDSSSAPNGWCVAHFPVRSANQLARKVLVGWISVLANPDRGPRTAYHWKKWFDLMSDVDMAGLDVSELAMTYLSDGDDTPERSSLVPRPLPENLSDFTLQYRREGVKPLTALAAAAELLAKELADARRALEGKQA